MSHNPGYVSLLSFEQTFGTQGLQVSPVDPSLNQTLLLVSDDQLKQSNTSTQVLLVADLQNIQGSTGHATLVQMPSASVMQVNSAFSNSAFFQTGLSSVEMVPSPVYVGTSDHVILCLQPEEVAGLQLPSGVAAVTSSPIVLQDNSGLETLESAALTQAAKGWHADSDLVNRALMALSSVTSSSRQTIQPSDSNPVSIENLHLNHSGHF